MPKGVSLSDARRICVAKERNIRTLLDLTKFGLSAAISTFVGRRTLSCTWELTHRCTGKCQICNYWRNPSRPEDELTLIDIQKGLKKIHSYGCRWVNFTGGEPTLRADLEDIISYSSAMGMWTTMVTNGSLLTRERVRSLGAAGLDSMFISLDSIDPQVHDKQRGIKGSSNQVLRCLRWLHEDFFASYKIGGVMCVLTTENIRHYGDILALAAHLGVYVVFQPYHINKTGEISFSPALNEQHVKGILDKNRVSRNLLCTKSYIKGFAAYSQNGFLAPCHAGLKYFSIDPLGFLHPCVDMPRAGHLLIDDMSVIRSVESLNHVRSCPGCWYNFRGEGSVTLSLKGFFEKLGLGITVIRKNRSFRRRTGSC